MPRSSLSGWFLCLDNTKTVTDFVVPLYFYHLIPKESDKSGGSNAFTVAVGFGLHQTTGRLPVVGLFFFNIYSRVCKYNGPSVYLTFFYNIILF